MEELGFVFPGQGSQRVGMGLDLVRRHPGLIERYYHPADEIIGWKLSQLCWQGPASALQDTAVTQPAVFLSSLCALDVLAEAGLEPAVVAGHSLGEYAALVAAEVLAWTDALRLVRIRGRMMAAVNADTPGAMVAVLGLKLAVVEQICARARVVTGQLVEVANDNAPDQTVVSGRVAAVNEAIAEATRAGAVRVVPLAVGAPFHCGLMADIAEQFRSELAEVAFHDPVGEIVSSVTAEPVTTGEQARGLLVEQLTERVRWTGTVTRMAGSGLDRFVEVGPGRVLSGLSRKIAPAVPVHRTDDTRQVSALLATLSADSSLL